MFLKYATLYMIWQPHSLWLYSTDPLLDVDCCLAISAVYKGNENDTY